MAGARVKKNEAAPFFQDEMEPQDHLQHEEQAESMKCASHCKETTHQTINQVYFKHMNKI